MNSMTQSIRRVLTSAALLVAVAAAPAVRAATPTTTDEARSWGQIQKMKAMEVMHAVDTDGKGYVTQEEFLKFQESLFRRMDRNQDGKVDAQEWVGKDAKTAAATTK